MIPLQIQDSSAARTAAPFTHAPPTGGVRLRPARLGDMAAVEPLISDYARKGLLLPKTLEQLHRTFREFLIAEDEVGRVVGCAALRVHTPQVAEVSALAVAEGAHGRGIGRRLLERLVEEARGLELETLFAMTLEPDFFRRLEFRQVERTLFPTKIAADCLTCPRRDGCEEITMARSLVAAADGTMLEASDG